MTTEPGRVLLPKPETEADAAWLIAGQTNGEDPVGVRSEDFADISRIASAIADSSDRGIKIERAAILRDAAALVEGKLQLRQRQIGAEVFRVAGQVFAAELLKLLVLAIEEVADAFVAGEAGHRD